MCSFVKGPVPYRTSKTRTNSAEVEIHRTVYNPYVLAVQTNQLLQLKNRDPIRHTAMIMPPPGNVNQSKALALPAARQSLLLSFGASTVEEPRSPKETWGQRIRRWLALKPAPKPPRTSSPFIRFKCDLHPWEYGYVAVIEHPFFAITDRDGAFELPPLPVGHYTLEAVHLKAGTNTQQIQIRSDERKPLTITFKAPSGSER
jgi:hypothetical protein